MGVQLLLKIDQLLLHFNPAHARLKSHDKHFMLEAMQGTRCMDFAKRAMLR